MILFCLWISYIASLLCFSEYSVIGVVYKFVLKSVSVFALFWLVIELCLELLFYILSLLFDIIMGRYG